MRFGFETDLGEPLNQMLFVINISVLSLKALGFMIKKVTLRSINYILSLDCDADMELRSSCCL